MPNIYLINYHIVANYQQSLEYFQHVSEQLPPGNQAAPPYSFCTTAICVCVQSSACHGKENVDKCLLHSYQNYMEENENIFIDLLSYSSRESDISDIP